MQTSNGIEPLGYVLGRELTKEEMSRVGGGADASAQAATLTGSGGGIPGKISGSIDGDVVVKF